MKIFQLLYTSFKSELTDMSSISSMIKRARMNNQACGITGVLIFDGFYFCQYLEGTKTHVRGLMEKILRDNRHSHVEIHYEGLAESSRFQHWSMAYANVEQDNLQAIRDTYSHEALNLWENLVPKLDMM